VVTVPFPWTGVLVPLATVTNEGEQGLEVCERSEELPVIWSEAPESITQDGLEEE
jgi:hypothetical protein